MVAGENEHLDSITNAIVEGNYARASSLIDKALDEGVDAVELINNCLKPSLEKLGEGFERGEVYLPTLVSAVQLLDHVSDRCGQSCTEGGPTMVIGTVSNDIHEIGKNICASMARVKGFNVRDLGCDVPSRDFVNTAVKTNSKVIAVSSTMKSTQKYQKEVVELAAESGIPVLVGGASCTPTWAETIRAAGYSHDSVEFVNLLNKKFKV